MTTNDILKDIVISAAAMAVCVNCGRTDMRCEMFQHASGPFCIGCEQIWDESHPVRETVGTI